VFRLRRLFDLLDRKSWSVSDPNFAIGLLGGSVTATGQPVTATTAMHVAPFALAVRLIAEACGTTPAKVFSRDPKAPAPDHPAYELVHDFANEWTPAPRFREIVTADAILHGAGYAIVTRVNDQPRELHRVDQRRTPVQRKFMAGGEPFYVVGNGADAVTVPFTDMLYLPGFLDMSSVDVGREAIGLSALLERHTSRFFAKSARPSGALMFNASMPPEKMTAIKTAWDAAHSGENAGGTAIIDGTGGGDFKTVTPSNQASELTQQRQFQIDEIARITGVPPTMLFSLDRGTWGNVEQLMLQFRQFALNPWLQRWADAYSIVLLTPEERARFYVEFLTDDLAAADQAAQATAFSQYRSMGAMTANEVRAVRNLPALPDGNTLANPFTTSNKPETP